jgi:hypothetical protein
MVYASLCYKQYATAGKNLSKIKQAQNDFAGIYIRLGKICIFLLPSLAGKPH